MKKILFLDIDYTTFHNQTPRPFLKEFLFRMLEKYEVHFYTAANIWRVKEVCRILEEKLGIDREIVWGIYHRSLSRETCPMIHYQKPDKTYIEIKCLQKAADRFRVSIDDVRLLDDMPMHDNPQADQRITAPGFWGQENDTFLKTLEI